MFKIGWFFQAQYVCNFGIFRWSHARKNKQHSRCRWAINIQMNILEVKSYFKTFKYGFKEPREACINQKLVNRRVLSDFVSTLYSTAGRELNTVGLQLGKHSPPRPEILCTHRVQHTFSEGAPTAAARMYGLTRPESMWAQQSKNDKGPPHLLKDIKLW